MLLSSVVVVVVVIVVVVVQTNSAASQGEWITQSPLSRVVNQNSMPAHSSPEYDMIPRHRLPGQASAQHQAYFPNTGSHIQPAVSGTVSQNPVHYRQYVISDLPSRNVPGKKKVELHTADSLAGTHVKFHWGNFITLLSVY
jgi:hypothetical protein